jgi:hypothetical protein
MVNITLNPAFINDTGATASIVKALFDNVGGSWFITIMLIMLFLILIAIVMRLPIELTALFMLPLFIACWIYNVPDFAGITGAFVLYVAIILGKNFFFNR